MENISWIDHVRNEEVLHSVKKERNVLHTRKKKAKWIGDILHRKCYLKRVIKGNAEGRIEVTGRLGIRYRQLLDDLKERGGCRKLKAKVLDRTLWRLALEGIMDLS